MKTLSSIIILCFALTFSNAQDVSINSDMDQNADFSKYKTFTMMDRDEAATGMDKDKHDKHDRAKGETTGSGYGTQGATGATTGDDTMADTQEPKEGDISDEEAATRNKDQGLTGEQGTADSNQDMKSTDTEYNQNQTQTGTNTHSQTGTHTQTQTGIGTGTTDDNATVGNTEGSETVETTGTDRDVNANKSTYGTSNENKSHAKMDKKQLKKAIKAEMESKGFTYTEGEADLVVNYSVFDGESEFAMGQDLNKYSAWGPQIGQAQNDPLTIEEGTIVVHLVDAEQNQLVYQAFANGAAENGSLQNEEKVKEVVSRIFDDIPANE
ncbi:MAG: DUF4136 domain-containing protein [Bacteroidota bacterium]|nr:DUF4136 domain-containing protein [Bacteroidota bacterium]